MSSSQPCHQPNVTFVLVRPQFLGNIGSMARLCKNFGFDSLALVQPPANFKDAEARQMAVGAFNVLKQARVWNSLSEAVAQSHLVLGTSTCFQRNLEPINLVEACAQAAEASHHRSIAIVFGDEKNGLSVEDLHFCHRIVRIPSNPDFPSLNLAQAAAVVAYELTRGNNFAVPPNSSSPKYGRSEFPTVAEESEFFALSERFLTRIDFIRSYNRQVVMNDLHGLYKRIMPRKRELDLLRGLLFKSLSDDQRSDPDSV